MKRWLATDLVIGLATGIEVVEQPTLAAPPPLPVAETCRLISDSWAGASLSGYRSTYPHVGQGLSRCSVGLQGSR